MGPRGPCPEALTEVKLPYVLVVCGGVYFDGKSNPENRRLALPIALEKINNNKIKNNRNLPQNK